MIERRQMRQVGQGGLPVALREDQERHRDRRRAGGVELTIADIEGLGLPWIGAKARQGGAQGRRMGLAFGHRVAADDAGEQARDSEMLQNDFGDGMRLVRADSQGVPTVRQQRQGFGDAGKQPGHLRGVLIAQHEGRDVIGLLVVGQFACGNDLLPQNVHAAADEAANLFKGQQGRPVLAQHGVHASVDIGRAVDQRAVQIEDDGTRR